MSFAASTKARFSRVTKSSFCALTTARGSHPIDEPVNATRGTTCRPSYLLLRYTRVRSGSASERRTQTRGGSPMRAVFARIGVKFAGQRLYSCGKIEHARIMPKLASHSSAPRRANHNRRFMRSASCGTATLGCAPSVLGFPHGLPAITLTQTHCLGIRPRILSVYQVPGRNSCRMNTCRNLPVTVLQSALTENMGGVALAANPGLTACSITSHLESHSCTKTKSNSIRMIFLQKKGGWGYPPLK